MQRITSKASSWMVVLLCAMLLWALVGCSAGSSGGSTASNASDASNTSGASNAATASTTSDTTNPANTANSSNAASTDTSSNVASSPSSSGSAATDAATSGMSISSSGVINGVLADQYGMRGTQKNGSIPTLSPPLSISGAPQGTACFALIMEDPDSVPVCGYIYTHWLAANIKDPQIPQNASLDDAANMLQGVNDFGSTGYGGPTPPDKPHTYHITVYALDSTLDLEEGFTKDDLLTAMQGHIVAQAELDAEYAN